ncbi:hypothetical protein COB64_02265 [Candidatus Wolfebacteria bacterium]|nr:MAG: hypothetical protein COB64_02265 [Candidatus Wolfebacteria bacterium]
MKNISRTLFSVSVVAFLIFAGLNSPNDTTIVVNTEIQSDISGTILIPNEGGNSGGHTPRGFSGSGSGLFVGDNLNPSFPEGDGVQTFLSFDLSDISEIEVSSAFLHTDNVEIEGTPFEDLGNLVVDAISYDEFSEDLWNQSPSERVCILATSRDDAFECDVSSFINKIIDSGDTKAQFRIRFDTAGDSDGRSDMVFFNITDINTNEEGIFELKITSDTIEENKIEVDSVEDIQIPIVAFLIKDSAGASTQRDKENLESLFANSQKIWDEAGIVLDVSIEEIVLNEDLIHAVSSGNFRALYSVLPSDIQALNIFYIRDLLGPNGIAISPNVGLVADRTSVDDFRATAHEIGHLLGLDHTSESRSRLMFPGANGRELTADEIRRTRAIASLLVQITSAEL